MSEISQNDFLYVKRLVEERAAIMIEPGKEYLVASRLNSLAREEGVASHVELLNKLRARTDPRLGRRVIEAMTTNETSFFRDHWPFEALATTVLPDLIAKRRSTRTLDIWCAACSTGQEPYTIWLVLRERFPELADWKVKILGTDLSSEVIAKAREGRYSQLEVNRGIPSQTLVRRFERDGVQWKVRDEARQVCEFRELNLIDAWPPMARPDVVFLRNVLIYFDIATKKKILGRIAKLIATDGYLFLGAGETTLNLEPAFQRVDIDRAGCFRLRPKHSAPARKEESWSPPVTISSR